MLIVHLSNPVAVEKLAVFSRGVPLTRFGHPNLIEHGTRLESLEPWSVRTRVPRICSAIREILSRSDPPPVITIHAFVAFV